MPEEIALKYWRITIHCSASSNGKEYPLELLKKDHLRRGFTDIGYHFVIQPNGDLQYGRILSQYGAHVETENKGNIGICLVGTDRFSKAQFEKLRDLYNDLWQRFKIEPWQVFCHREFKSAQKQGKTCPNFLPQELLYFLFNNKLISLNKNLLS